MARESKTDYYAILGVHPNAEDIVIRAAFKALAQRYHPDRFGGSKEDAHRKMADLTNAYETLADPLRRRKYDRRRRPTGRSTTFYFKNPARERQGSFGALAARAAAVNAQRYRIAVYVLMAAVVVLSAFNIYQHSAQIRELFTSPRGLSMNSGASDVGDGSGAAASRVDPFPSGALAPFAPGNVRPLPTGNNSTRPIGTNPVDPLVPVSPAPSITATSEKPMPANTAKSPVRPVAPEPVRANVAPATSQAANDTAHKDAKRPVAKVAAAKPPAQPDRPAPSRAAATAEGCKIEVAALGLCTRDGSAKGQ